MTPWMPWAALPNMNETKGTSWAALRGYATFPYGGMRSDGDAMLASGTERVARWRPSRFRGEADMHRGGASTSGRG